MDWNPVQDDMMFHISLNFSAKKRGAHIEPDLKPSEVPMSLPNILTRRMVLQQVMTIYDPLGIISPFMLKAKILLRETWQLGLAWDEALPQQMKARWESFFTDLFRLEELRLPRALITDGVVGKPWLILFQ